MENLVKDLMAFLDGAVCNFLAVKECEKRLAEKGFEKLDPADEWVVKPGGRYYITKNDSAIFAWVQGTGDAAAGWRIISAHSDSPGFRIKPHAEMLSKEGVLQLNTEVYGGPILYTWFDRPLSIAGRVVLRNPEDALKPLVKIIKFDQPLLTIPHLAIHFNRQVNEGNKLSRQKDMIPVMAILDKQANVDNYLLKMVAEKADVAPGEILDFDLTLYDTTPACLVGPNQEMISSGRLDDLSMVHASLSALMEACDTPCEQTRVMAIFDNEETGSGTKQGAASPVLCNLLQRLNMANGGSEETFVRAIDRSFMISADNAHAIHPNYPEKHDPTNHPVLGGGPVVKINANCKYMTDAVSAGIYKEICRKADVPVQEFVNHSDSAGGSTLGNILTSQIDLRGVDMGAAMWAMHSCRETASPLDHQLITRSFHQFYIL
ncbi:MAG: M18 family aminopeptidase [Bacteroidales bacterium]|nr:M18 family aminopeptidase [Bacteroidales bacterium]